jgi:hypothetical protein
MDLLVGTEWAVAMSTKDTVLKSRRPEEKRTKNRNREGEKVALANQHTFDIVFIIKLQQHLRHRLHHQAPASGRL